MGNRVLVAQPVGRRQATSAPARFSGLAADTFFDGIELGDPGSISSEDLEQIPSGLSQSATTYLLKSNLLELFT